MTCRGHFDPCAKPYSNVKFLALSKSWSRMGVSLKNENWPSSDWKLLSRSIQGHKVMVPDDPNNFIEVTFLVSHYPDSGVSIVLRHPVIRQLRNGFFAFSSSLSIFLKWELLQTVRENFLIILFALLFDFSNLISTPLSSYVWRITVWSILQKTHFSQQ